LPLPRTGKDTPLRFQAFINGGRLLALRDTRPSDARSDPMNSGDVVSSVTQTMGDLANGLPSCAAGFGLVYAHPAARFEVNFSLPLVLRKGEDGRKGLSFGVGLSFL
jgi:outer membrane protein insertion porin family